LQVIRRFADFVDQPWVHEIGAIDYLTKPAAPERNPISSAYTAALAETPAAGEQTRFNEFPLIR
jgi:hypothetical protein